jgi:anthranilate phosphoribosyltransferase
VSDSPLTRLFDPGPLTRADADRLVERLTAATTPEAERGALLMGLELRGVTAEELASLALALRDRAVPFPVGAEDRPVDLCGSGGAPHPSFNVSTLSAFVVAAAGVQVVKHGNRSARRPTGSSDLLEALGLPIATSREFPAESYQRFGLAFLHAPLFHPTAHAVASARKALGIPTVFNRLGPLTNPARVAAQVVGAPDAVSADLLAHALRRLGTPRGLVVHSDDGRDELSPTGRTSVIRWDRSGLHHGRIDGRTLLAPEDREGDWGPLAPPAAAAEAERVLAGGGGSVRGAVLLTSAAALSVGGRARDLGHGVELAAEALDSGAAEEKLRELRGLARERAWTEAS